MTAQIYVNARFFDGDHLHEQTAIRVAEGCLSDMGPIALQKDGQRIDINGDIIAPGYVDLQVNGGGGVMVNDTPTPEGLGQIAAAHSRLGTAALLPTLITASYDTTAAAIWAAKTALANGVPGVAGLHLEGPHLDPQRKGAHDAALIRPMTAADLDLLIDAAQTLPAFMLTIAPESCTTDQVAQLVQAGAVVSLGHSACNYDTALRYVQAGARCVTHLFNAMSPLTSREPGLVGTALDRPELSAGVIADGIHVHPVTLRRAWAAKQGPGQLFLVTDAMAVAGTDLDHFHLDGRRINRDRSASSQAPSRLTLADGTLAGADLDLTQALRLLHHEVGVTLPAALAAATSVPADLMGLSHVGRLHLGQPLRHPAAMIRIASDLSCVTPLV